MAKYATQQAVGLVRLLGCTGGAKRSAARILVRVLLPVVHLLLECLGLLFVGEREPRHAILELEGVEEDAVLVVSKCVVDFLVPEHATACRRDVDKLEPECVADQVVG